MSKMQEWCKKCKDLMLSNGYISIWGIVVIALLLIGGFYWYRFYLYSKQKSAAVAQQIARLQADKEPEITQDRNESSQEDNEEDRQGNVQEDNQEDNQEDSQEDSQEDNSILESDIKEQVRSAVEKRIDEVPVGEIGEES